MIISISDDRNSTWELLQLIKTFSNVVGYRINFKKIVVLLYANDKQAEKEIREPTSFTIATTIIKYLEVTLAKQGEKSLKK